MAKAKVKIPKKVAGVKVPKPLRKEAKKALKLADSLAVRELAVSGLTLAAQALIDKTQAKAAESAEAGRRQVQATLKANLDALHLGDVLRAAAMEGARRFLEGFEQAQSAGPAAAPAPGAAAKPKAKAPARAKAPAKPKPKKATPRRPAGAAS